MAYSFDLCQVLNDLFILTKYTLRLVLMSCIYMLLFLVQETVHLYVYKIASIFTILLSILAGSFVITTF
jgi:hypothetical protein